MTIETKCKIGDEVYLIYFDEIKKGIIIEIHPIISGSTQNIKYLIDRGCFRTEDQIFKDINELISYVKTL